MMVKIKKHEYETKNYSNRSKGMSELISIFFRKDYENFAAVNVLLQIIKIQLIYSIEIAWKPTKIWMENYVIDQGNTSVNSSS